MVTNAPAGTPQNFVRSHFIDRAIAVKHLTIPRRLQWRLLSYGCDAARSGRTCLRLRGSCSIVLTMEYTYTYQHTRVVTGRVRVIPLAAQCNYTAVCTSALARHCQYSHWNYSCYVTSVLHCLYLTHIEQLMTSNQCHRALISKCRYVYRQQRRRTASDNQGARSYVDGTIKFANSPPCACRDSTGQKP